MNAYELADVLEGTEMPTDTQIFDAATMLRQQADRIAELEADVKKKITMIKMWEATANKTHPVKQLSDEEIYKLWCEADNTELLPEMRLKDGSINYIITTFAELVIKASRGEEC